MKYFFYSGGKRKSQGLFISGILPKLANVWYLPRFLFIILPILGSAKLRGAGATLRGVHVLQLEGGGGGLASLQDPSQAVDGRLQLILPRHHQGKVSEGGPEV